MKFSILLFILSLSLSGFSSEKITKILILGDSLTEGYGVAKKDAYPQQLEELLKEKKKDKNIKIIAAGSSGSTSASGVSRMKWHLRAKPQLLILALGANDGLRGIDVKATEKNLAKTIELAQKNKIKVLLAGLYLPYNYGEKYRKEFRQVFEDLYKKYKIGFIPFLLKDVGGKPEFNLADGIHPNEKGHRKMAENLLPIILKHL